MAHAAATFKASDLKRAVKAVRAAGLSVERTEIETDGRIVLVHSRTKPADDADRALDEWKQTQGSHSA